MKKRVKGIILAVCICVGLLTGRVQVEASGMPGARSYKDASGNIFLGGNYIEVGVCSTGIFGTTAAPDAEKGFHFIEGKESNGAYLGLLADGDGWNTGNAPVAGDFFTPGSPEERWVLAYEIEGTKKEFPVATRNPHDLSAAWTEGPTVNDSSNAANGTLAATVTGTTVDGVSVVMTYHFGVNDLEYITDVTVENNSGKAISEVRFIRGFDPDQDVWFNGTYNTYNKVLCNPNPDREGGAKNFALVVARGERTGAGVFFLSFDNRAYGKLLGSLAPTSEDIWGSVPVSAVHAAKESDITWSSANSNGYTNVDAGIMMATVLGNIANTGTASTSFITSLDPDVLRSVNKLVNAALDYTKEILTELEPLGSYEIECEGETYEFVASAEGTIALSGTDKNGKAYDFIGKKISVVLKGDGVTTEDSVPMEIEVAGRPTAQEPNAPTNTPSDIFTDDIETTTTTIKVKAVEGQEYRIGTDGDWVRPDENGYVTFTGLTELTDYSIYTRVMATGKNPASLPTNGVIVKTMGMFAPTRIEFSGTYDGASHELKVEPNVEGATVTYAEAMEGPYTETPFFFSEKGEHTVYYCISKENYYNSYGTLTANILDDIKVKHSDEYENGNFGGGTIAGGITNSLTPEIETAVMDGKDVSIWVESNDISDSVAEEEKTKLEENLPKDYQTGPIMEISLKQSIDGGEKTSLSEINTPIQIQMEIPTELLQDNRSYKVMRYSNGTATILDGVKNGEKLVFETSQFGTFVILYSDKVYETADKKEEGSHTHIYEWGDGDQVSKEKDGNKVYQCILCGHILEKANIPAYAYTCLTESEHVLKTPKNGSVICEMGRWNAYPRWFFEKLATRPDVDITLKFLYEKKPYTVYLPVGTKIDTSCEWYGPMKICSLYPYEVK